MPNTTGGFATRATTTPGSAVTSRRTDASLVEEGECGEQEGAKRRRVRVRTCTASATCAAITGSGNARGAIGRPAIAARTTGAANATRTTRTSITTGCRVTYARSLRCPAAAPGTARSRTRSAGTTVARDSCATTGSGSTADTACASGAVCGITAGTAVAASRFAADAAGAAAGTTVAGRAEARIATAFSTFTAGRVAACRRRITTSASDTGIAVGYR